MITGTDIVEDARQYLGAPYVPGGRSRTGLDCVGLVILVARDFGLNWECETPTAEDYQSGVAWETVGTSLQRFGFKQMDVTDWQIGDLVVIKTLLGGAGTVKIVSAGGGLASFFGASKFIHYREPTFLEESVLGVEVFQIKRELRMNVQDYVKKLWRFYRFPFVRNRI